MTDDHPHPPHDHAHPHHDHIHPHLAAKPRRNWRKIHHSPVFWVGAVLFLAAITIYVLSQDLSWRPYVR